MSSNMSVDYIATEEEVAAMYKMFDDADSEQRSETQAKPNGIYSLMSHSLGENIPFVGHHEHTGKMIAVIHGNQMYVGRLKETKTGPRSSTTLCLMKTTILRVNRRVTKHGTIPLWTLWADDDNKAFEAMSNIYEYTGAIPEASEASQWITSHCPREPGHAANGFCMVCVIAS